LKSLFVSTVSHDLKTPLTSIKIIAELMQQKKDLPAAWLKEYAELIEGETDRLTRLINNVLNFSKIERGIKDYNFSTIYLNDIVRNTLRIMKYQLKSQNVTVKMSLLENEEPVQGDADALTEVIINLISNAVKYSLERREIHIATWIEKGEAALSVQDFGIGIPAEKIESIFEPYYRVKSERAERVSGIGLGLSIVKHILDAHHCRIAVKSVVGEGSTFTLYFPLESNEEHSTP
jgi:signal transduction histidine kinase